MRILTWNVNGIRSVGKKGFLDWLEKESPDILCLQEVRAHPAQVDPSLSSPFGFQSWWHPARKPGYSGVAIYSKSEPVEIVEGLGHSTIDEEGRVLIAHYADFSVINAYFPNSQRDHARLPFKLEFCDLILAHAERLRSEGRNVILCGDYNIAHREIDLRNPKTNLNNAGFLPQERAWMDRFLGHGNGWIDTFRNFVSEGGHYTWWSNRPGVRQKNIGWRLDYHCVNSEFLPAVRESWIMPHVFGSDHCPAALELK